MIKNHNDQNPKFSTQSIYTTRNKNPNCPQKKEIFQCLTKLVHHKKNIKLPTRPNFLQWSTDIDCKSDHMNYNVKHIGKLPQCHYRKRRRSCCPWIDLLLLHVFGRPEEKGVTNARSKNGSGIIEMIIKRWIVVKVTQTKNAKGNN